MPSDIKLTYFNIQGVAEKVRLALALGGITFVDERVDFSQWTAMKPTTPFGQLPLLTVDGAPPVSQSDAMLRWAGRLATMHKGVPLFADDDALAIDEALGLVADLNTEWRTPVFIGMNPAAFGYAKEFKGTPEHMEVVKAIREKWMAENFPKFMGFVTARVKGGGFMAGDTVTIADCALIPALARFTSGSVDHVPATCMEAFPEVAAYIERFMALPEVAAYYKALGGPVVPAPPVVAAPAAAA